ncbi:hypothetical protein WJX82_002995 [Trebouxia sp. C0006]
MTRLAVCEQVHKLPVQPLHRLGTSLQLCQQQSSSDCYVLIYLGPQGRWMASNVTSKDGDLTETIPLIEGRLHIPTVQNAFTLRVVKIDGALAPVDSQGFTYAIFKPGDTLNISGTPAEVAAMPGGHQYEPVQDEVTLAGYVDSLLWHVWKCMDTSKALLFKGEDKTSEAGLEEAIEDLRSKLKFWGQAVHGPVQYLLCYACAGSQFQLCAMQRGSSVVYRFRHLEPVRQPVYCKHFDHRPRSFRDLKNSIRCILHALEVLHQAGFAHTDLRWENIIQHAGQWVLIDLEFACVLNSLPFTPEGHARKASGSNTSLRDGGSVYNPALQDQGINLLG